MEKTGVPLLEIEHMYKQFGGNPVLKGVDLTLKAGEIFAMAGGNGAGKKSITDNLLADSMGCRMAPNRISFFLSCDWKEQDVS